MKRPSPILSLWMLILIALVIFVALSFHDDITLGSYTLSKAHFPETLLASSQKEEQEEPPLPADTLETSKDTVLAPDTTVHNVLVFGDSMTHNLALSIAKYGTKNGYRVTSVTWESSSIPGWSNSGKIRKYVDSVKPDFIFVSLGSNEMELRYFDRRIPEVEKIIQNLDTIPYVWVGPPLWKEDKGVYAMLESTLPKGVLFRVGEDVAIPRGKDKVHPTIRGAQLWADTLMRWIATSPHPILNEVPDSGTSTKGHKFIYLHPSD